MAFGGKDFGIACSLFVAVAVLGLCCLVVVGCIIGIWEYGGSVCGQNLEEQGERTFSLS